MVVSPHLDDAVLSLGSTISAAARSGAKVQVLTVLSGDPESQAAAGPWDRLSGFTTEGEAARARRAEDRKACTILGASAHWLPFADEQYERHGDDEQIASTVAAFVHGADVVLIPGAPLDHPDHAWLSSVLLGRHIEVGHRGLYAEQPYGFQSRDGLTTGLAAALRATLTDAPCWQRVAGAPQDWRRKHAAIKAYRSQLRLLGLGLLGTRRMLHFERSRGGEAVAWLAS